ncbi:fec operon regulator FecR [compost metagenome]
MVDIQPDHSGLGRGIGAGQQVGFSANRIGPPAPVQAGHQAWSRGILLADNLRLVDFLAELARYRHGYLGCDPRIAELRVVGAFPLADSDRVLDALAATLPVRVQRRMSWWVSLEPSGEA